MLNLDIQVGKIKILQVAWGIIKDQGVPWLLDS
jgi:hypothetical protein